MQDNREAASGSLARSLKWAEAVLVVIGLVSLGWCALRIADAQVAQYFARRLLAPAPRVEPLPPSAPPALVRGQAMAALSIPRLHLSAMVLHGSDDRTLRRGLGHIEDTAVPGQPGNVAIAGHRDSFFRPLKNVVVGDDVFLDTRRERLHYRVSSFRVVRSDDLSVLRPTPDATLTLVTCYPFGFIGRAPDRFIVRATRVEAPGSSTAQSAAGVLGPYRVLQREDSFPMPAPRSSSPATAASNDNDRQVRQTIDRFRAIYNARLMSRDEIGQGGPLLFQTCSIRFVDDSSIATCESWSRSIETPDPSVWTFTLRQDGFRWAIQSVAAR
jgi:sortase A